MAPNFKNKFLHINNSRNFTFLAQPANYTVDYVLIYSDEYYKSSSPQHSTLFEDWKTEGGILRTFPSLENHLTDGYYRGCFEKFYVFLLTEFDRVMLMDADGFPNSNLDHLFWYLNSAHFFNVKKLDRFTVF